MSAPADIISRKRSITRPANAVAVWFKKYFIKLYVALDKTQRKRAAEIIHRYEYLTSKRDELSGEKKWLFCPRNQVTNSSVLACQCLES